MTTTLQHREVKLHPLEVLARWLGNAHTVNAQPPLKTGLAVGNKRQCQTSHDHVLPQTRPSNKQRQTTDAPDLILFWVPYNLQAFIIPLIFAFLNNPQTNDMLRVNALVVGHGVLQRFPSDSCQILSLVVKRSTFIESLKLRSPKFQACPQCCAQHAEGFVHTWPDRKRQGISGYFVALLIHC